MLEDLYQDGARHVELRHVPNLIFRVVKSEEGEWVNETLSVEEEMGLFKEEVEKF